MKIPQKTLSKEAIGRIKRLILKFDMLKFKIKEVDSDKLNSKLSVINEGGRVKSYYKMSGYCKRITAVIAVVLIAFFWYLLFSSSGTYLSAWYISLALSICVLFIISFPRRIDITNSHIEIHCVLELTTIPLEDVKRVYRIERYRINRCIPIIGSYGFGGFFGYYLDLRSLKTLRIYATQLENLIIIQDIYNQKFVVNSNNPDMFVEIIRQKTKDNIIDSANSDDEEEEDSQ